MVMSYTENRLLYYKKNHQIFKSLEGNPYKISDGRKSGGSAKSDFISSYWGTEGEESQKGPKR